MRKNRIDKELIARDAFFLWKARARAAASSVTIFSPYLDRVARFVLAAADRLPAHNRFVVTCLNAETLLAQPAQLIELKRLLSGGYSVLHLDSLHAKALLVDDSLVTLGSQNFTGRGRKNKEATALPCDSIVGSTLAATLIEWRESAIAVDEGYIDDLITKLGPFIRTHRKLLKEAQSAIDQSLHAWEEAVQRRIEQERHRKLQDEERRLRAIEEQKRLQAEEEERRRKLQDEERRRRAIEEQERLQAEEGERQKKLLEARLARLAEESRIQLQSRIVYARLKEVGSWESRYESLVVWGAHSLMLWQRVTAGRGREPYELNWLSMYPAFFSDSGRMAFVRLAKSRITYARSVVRWNEPLDVGDVGRVTAVQMPHENLSRRNLEIAVDGRTAGACKVQVKLMGSDLQLAGIEADPYRFGSQDLARELGAHLAAPASLRSLVERALSDFRYSTLGRDNPNMRQFVEAGPYYRIRLYELGKSPVLWIAKHTNE
jgi:hypothetical protein